MLTTDQQEPMSNTATQYHCLYSCNKCGGKNNVKAIDHIEHVVCEAETSCQNCGFKDYWAYGFFESGQDGMNKCKKYQPSQTS